MNIKKNEHWAKLQDTVSRLSRWIEQGLTEREAIELLQGAVNQASYACQMTYVGHVPPGQKPHLVPYSNEDLLPIPGEEFGFLK